ncbi:hypothetical protein C5167_007382 [Papaver somniferum]|nr:hypothetical protein C5167_007382 [Papaver somniferum]
MSNLMWDASKGAMIPEFDLREINLYFFQGLLKNEGIEKYGVEIRQWKKDAPYLEIDGHYPIRELWVRESVLVVDHNVVNQSLVATTIVMGTEYFRVLIQSNCGASIMDFTHADDN